MANKSRITANLVSNTGISTFTDLNITRVNITGVGTISNGSITTLNANTGNIVTGVTTNFTSTNGSITNLTGTSSTITTLRSTTGNFTTGNIVTGVTTNFNATNVVITGVTTVSAGTALLPSITPSGDPNTGVFFPSADTIAFSEGGAEAVRIDGSGRLLVGTTTNNPTFESRVQVAGSGGGATILIDAYSANSNAPVLYFGKSRNATVGTQTIVQNNDPLGAIDFYGADNSGPVNAATITCRVDGTPGTNDMPGMLVFSTTADGASAPTDRMKISSSGVFTHFNDSVYNFRTAQAASGAAAGIDLTHSATGLGNGTLSFRVFTNGNAVNTNNSYLGISDIKLKENIVDANAQWDDLKALRVRNYNLKEETGQQTHTQIGLIAQEVELISPGLVSESPDRDADGSDLGTVTKSVNYSVLYMKAVKALQEAMERIETLEAKVAALESA